MHILTYNLSMSTHTVAVKRFVQLLLFFNLLARMVKGRTGAIASKVRNMQISSDHVIILIGYQRHLI